MPKIERWENFPEGVRQHLIDRMRDRVINIADLNKLRLWVGTNPEVPEGDWYKDFGSLKICGRGALAKTFLLRGQVAKGDKLQ
jgi:hypothetical protein